MDSAVLKENKAKVTVQQGVPFELPPDRHHGFIGFVVLFVGFFVVFGQKAMVINHG